MGNIMKLKIQKNRYPHFLHPQQHRRSRIQVKLQADLKGSNPRTETASPGKSLLRRIHIQGKDHLIGAHNHHLIRIAVP